MALFYCSLHTRLFAFKHQAWIDFSQEKIAEIQGYYTLLRSANHEASFVEVVETYCDQCGKDIQQIMRIK